MSDAERWRWVERVRLVEARAELAREVLAGRRDDMLDVPVCGVLETRKLCADHECGAEDTGWASQILELLGRKEER